MLVVLSPSKTQDFSADAASYSHSQPVFAEESEKLVKILRKKSENSLGKLMDISQNLAELNHERFQNWQLPFNEKNSLQALRAFKGDVYTNIRVDEYSKKDFEFAQDHIRILSGLYGILKPMDLIQPYRLEMKTPLSNTRGKDLYAFWGERLAKDLAAELEQHDNPVLVNLASQEYFKALKLKKTSIKVVTPHFKEDRDGKLRVIALFAKKARGAMADYVVRERLTEPSGLAGFDYEGYAFREDLSDEENLIFVR
ncbi:peroxide stress protein YaaA [Roseivirga sp. BDSF3-8]|uniref:peroxide stress protein YaaA n=1 Tax=Roseivirga sp. BDSF3-8 TaxID=3241598 RepID=UPI0035324115